MSVFELGASIERAVGDLEIFAEYEPCVQKLIDALRDGEKTDSELKRLLRLAGIVNDRAYVGPEVVHLDVVGVCNLNCIYCRDHSPYLVGREKWRNMEMPFHRLQRVVREGMAIGSEQFPILGSGEPRLHTHWTEMIDFLTEQDVRFEIFTNGTLLNDRDVEQLAGAEKLKLYFSISAATEKTYKAFRPEKGGRLLPKIEESIMKLASLRRSNQGPRLVIVHVLNAMNAPELRLMVDQAVRTGVDEIQLKLTEYEPFNEKIMLDDEQIDGLRAALPQFKADLAVNGITVHDNIDAQLQEIEAESGLFSLDLYKRIGCYIGYDLVRVRRDGKVAMCCAIKWVGDLNRTTLGGHFFSADMDRYRWAGKRCFMGWNTPLPDGSPLMAADCHRCFNYITNLHLQRDLIEYGLLEMIERRVRAHGEGRMVAPGEKMPGALDELSG